MEHLTIEQQIRSEIYRAFECRIAANSRTREDRHAGSSTSFPSARHLTSTKWRGFTFGTLRKADCRIAPQFALDDRHT